VHSLGIQCGDFKLFLKWKILSQNQDNGHHNSFKILIRDGESHKAEWVRYSPTLNYQIKLLRLACVYDLPTENRDILQIFE